MAAQRAKRMRGCGCFMTGGRIAERRCAVPEESGTGGAVGSGGRAQSGRKKVIDGERAMEIEWRNERKSAK